MHLAVAEISSTQTACAGMIFEKEISGMRLFAVEGSSLCTFYRSSFEVWQLTNLISPYMVVVEKKTKNSPSMWDPSEDWD